MIFMVKCRGKGKNVTYFQEQEKESQNRDDIKSSKAFLIRKSRKSTRRK